jgi:hypothetical protein|tara:strand:+ start:3601 stop:3909 length:309 start_codon:yes stop_codon:yes gene_type:complete
MDDRNKYPQGSLFQNVNKSKDAHPDYTGTLELNQEVVEDLSNQFHAGVAFPKISIAGWKRTAKKSGSTFLSVKASVLQERRNRDEDVQPTKQTMSNDDPFSL